MHTNHRRKSVYRGRHHNRPKWPRTQWTFAWHKRRKAHKLRQRVREQLAHGRFDDMPRERRTILWEYW